MYHVVYCRECDPDLEVAFPFPTPEARGHWAAEHRRGTGHDKWLVFEEEYRNARLHPVVIAARLAKLERLKEENRRLFSLAFLLQAHPEDAQKIAAEMMVRGSYEYDSSGHLVGERQYPNVE